jgi:CspA family cold shock protein
MQATVLTWNRAVGYGFVAPEDGSDDLFVHRSAIVGAKRLIEGQKIEFEYGERNGKRLAINVVIVGGAK